MIFRVKFAKFGVLKFIGHLDVMRYFQKAVLRAGWDVVYSQGFHPHQIMSFAQPLSVGVTSSSEYMEIELHSFNSLEQLKSSINEVMTDGIWVNEITLLDEIPSNTKRITSMALVNAADYMVSVKDGYEFPFSQCEWECCFREYICQEEIKIQKKTKKSEKEIDCKPFILNYSFDLFDFYESGKISPEYIKDGTIFADSYDNDRRIFLQLTAGSETNIKPESIIESFCAFHGFHYDRFAYQIHRMELYSEQKGLQPLWAIR